MLPSITVIPLGEAIISSLDISSLDISSLDRLADKVEKRRKYGSETHDGKRDVDDAVVDGAVFGKRWISTALAVLYVEYRKKVSYLTSGGEI